MAEQSSQPQLSEEEQQKILETPPKGTFAIMLIYAVIFMAAWFGIYFGTLIARGPVSG